MQKTPDEIKKGLHNCLSGIDCPDDCPYYSDCIVCDDDYIVEREALAYIQQLEAENYGLKFTKEKDADVHRYQKAEMRNIIQQLESKLNQAVEDIRMLGRTGAFICPVCAHYNHGEGTPGECVKCLTGDGFRWRGEKEET